MSDNVHLLSAREKETLRLLLGGHDAKSIAYKLGISVHTVNERLREARRKLGVTSSREAARRLGELEANAPDFSVYKFLGDAERAPVATPARHQASRERRGYSLAWLGGGMVIMSLFVAVTSVISLLSASTGSQALNAQKSSASAAAAVILDNPAIISGRQWAMLLDTQHWDESWNAAGMFFKSQVAQPRWVALIESVRQPLGSVTSRVLQSVTDTSSPPGAPAGEYQILQFKTDFAQRPGAIETITVVSERSGWHVVGYYIR